ncbi:energy-coupling factor transporter transmembrane protein EcfT [Clostridium sp. DJ247]|uniref:energy-coupling factor transporter transmembrane component T family protein n=1 Tax=Clostridium sp. DJ247 TaxID=2726188 RepID=UPI001625F7F2|nr:energy-coupling factor transporter transmembrane component T [Clostridium sp. DJ247]MBC2580776.1 energy-coupling factor transporter transmembrane protein EcfT [Clostridium sp. DJ247]
MEEWLFKKDDYMPKEDKDKFIDKSVMEIIHILSLIKRNENTGSTLMYKLNPVVKVLFTILNILFISLSKNFLYVMILYVYLLLILSLIDIRDIKRILSLSLVIPAFTLVMLIPSMFMGNVKNSVLIILKIVGTVLSVNILSYTTKWHDITKALKIFFIPDIFILVFDITIKYIFILGEFSLHMLYALKLRSIGKNNNKYSSLTKIMGNLFLKSKEMGEEMYFAMECRGFTGEYISHIKYKLGVKELIYSFINVILIIVYFYLARM